MKELYKKHRARFLITGMVILLLMCTVISLDFYVYPNASSEYGWIVFLSVGERPATVVNLIKAQFFSAEMLNFIIATLSALATVGSWLAARQSSRLAAITNKITLAAYKIDAMPYRKKFNQSIGDTLIILHKLMQGVNGAAYENLEKFYKCKNIISECVCVFDSEFCVQADEIYKEIQKALHVQLGIYPAEEKTEAENKQDRDSQRKIWRDLHRKLENLAKLLDDVTR